MLKEQLSMNIGRYRREKGLTQEELAKILNVSFQAISKWENAQSLPDLTLLPTLSQVLGVSIDKLLGYIQPDQQVSIYEEEYKIDGYYWGVQPSKTCYRILELMPPTRPLKLLDIGCGEGKDAVFFARNGYDVTAFDISDAGIEKTKRLAESVGVNVQVFKADVLDYRLDTCYDILFSSGVLHYIKPDYRADLFKSIS